MRKYLILFGFLVGCVPAPSAGFCLPGSMFLFGYCVSAGIVFGAVAGLAVAGYILFRLYEMTKRWERISVNLDKWLERELKE